VLPVAPRLVGLRVAHVRPLDFCGRIFEGEIWLGCPFAEGLPDARHCAWQAAHEATVLEVSERARGRHAERDVERVAVVQLAERAAREGRAQEHQRWYEVLRAPPPARRDALPSALQALLD
jgi:hypothetical protein